MGGQWGAHVVNGHWKYFICKRTKQTYIKLTAYFQCPQPHSPHPHSYVTDETWSRISISVSLGGPCRNISVGRLLTDGIILEIDFFPTMTMICCWRFDVVWIAIKLIGAEFAAQQPLLLGPDDWRGVRDQDANVCNAMYDMYFKEHVLYWELPRVFNVLHSWP